jgi:hypothetical protein
MKVILDRYTISLIPESDQDIAFIEDTMGMWRDGDEISLERIDTENSEFGFRLETDLPVKPHRGRKDLPHPSSETYKRPLEDFIDFSDSFDGLPYKRDGDTKVL